MAYKLSWSFQVSFQVRIFMQHMCCITSKGGLVGQLYWNDLIWGIWRFCEIWWNIMCCKASPNIIYHYLSLWRKAGGLPMRVEFMAIPTPKYSYSREIKVYVSQPWFPLSRCFSRHSRKTTIEVSETRWECLTRLFMGRCWKARFFLKALVDWNV